VIVVDNQTPTSQAAELSSLIARAAQPLVPPPYPGEENGPLRRPQNATQRRRRDEAIAAVRRDIAAANNELMARFVSGVDSGGVPEILQRQIGRMLRLVMSTDDPARAFRALLNPEVSGRPPGKKEDIEFGAAVGVARAIRTRGLSEEDAWSEVAGDPEKEATVRRWYKKHQIEALALVAWEFANSPEGWERLPTVEDWEAD
jgi:hypothetical protein